MTPKLPGTIYLSLQRFPG